MSRFGVFICQCDARPTTPPDPEALASEAAKDGRVAFAEIVEDLCARPFAGVIRDAIGGRDIDGAVLAACEPAVHESTFRSLLSFQGVPPHKVAVVDTGAEGELAGILQETLDRLAGATEKPSGDVVPRALVIGGGVAGIQASLDIAYGGCEVFLVEKDTSIGGHMLQLSEVFPTLDCPQCIMTPKMVEVAQHPNVKLRAYCEVDSIEGEAGRFKVRIRHKTPYIDWDKCTGCGECAKACPVDLYSDWDRGVATQNAAYRPFAQAVPNKFAIEKRGLSPCRAACPAGLNAHAYVSLIKAGKFERALEIAREGVLFPGILGRVCPHPCETACLRGTVDEPVRICALKRFIADRDEGPVPVPERAPDTGKKVAVVGSGPAGLAAAHDLRCCGHAVTVFEANDRIGGMMAFGIPDYRLPRDVLEKETRDLLEAMGVTFRLNTRIGKDVAFDDLRSGHDAVLLAVGAWKGVPLRVPGEDLGGVMLGVDFLVAVNRGGKPDIGNRVAVIGGGNTAIDAARCALRLGAEEVTLVYRRSRAEMPASPEEIEAAEEEGVRIRLLASPVSVKGEGSRVTGLEIQKNRLGEPDASGRRRPVPVPGSEEVLSVDTVLPAVSQGPDLRGLEADGETAVTRWSTLEADETTLATSLEGVFAAGDAVTGPDTVVGAVAGGRRAAESIRRLLEGRDLAEDRDPPRPPVVETPDTRHARLGRRPPLPARPAVERRRTFEEVEGGLDEEAAVAEASRCLSCGGCCECMECVKACEAQAVNHDLRDRIEEVEVGAVVMATGYELYDPLRIQEYDPDPDIIDGMQFERILCPSGPTDGQVFRPSDGRVPKEVVLLTCVGSRDPAQHKAYCSRVCCMYQIKMGMLYRHAVHDGQAHMFYMDIRCDGKLYEEFYQRGQEEEGIHFIRGRVSRIYRDGDQLVVKGVDTLADRAVEIRADLVVLATAMIPRPEGVRDAKRFGVETDADGFMRELHGKMMPLDSSREGLFLAGTCQGPKDIPECVAHASGTAGRVLALLGKGRRKREPEPAAQTVSSGKP